MTAFQPLLEMMAKVAEWFVNLPGPVQTFIVVLGSVLALFTLLMPLIASFGVALTTLGGGLGVAGAAAGGASIGFGALSTSLLPIIDVVLAIVAAITAVILIIQNWGSICDWFSEKIGQLSSWWGETWKGSSDTASGWISNAQGTIDVYKRQGQTLTATVEPEGATVSYQWKVADTAAGEYGDIAGATGKTHKLAADKVGKFIKVEVIGTGKYSGTVMSAPTVAVTASA